MRWSDATRRRSVAVGEEDWEKRDEERVLVWILSLMQRETSPVSKWAGNPAKVEGSPSRILSTNCLWLTRHGRETVWLTKLSQKLSLFLMFKSCLYWRWHFKWRNIFTGLISILNVGGDKRGQGEKHKLHSINTWDDISCGWFKEIIFFCNANLWMITPLLSFHYLSNTWHYFFWFNKIFNGNTFHTSVRSLLM